MAPRKRGNESKMEESGAQKRSPAFFKPYIPETCTHRLRLPVAFVRYMEGKLPSKAILRDRNGNTWPVKIGTDENDTCFLDGWTQFVRNNYMEAGDFFVFQFDGRLVFDVKLLGRRDSCDKRGVGCLIYKVKEEEKEEEEEGEEEEEDDHHHHHQDEEEQNENDDDEDYQFNGDEPKEEEDDDYLDETPEEEIIDSPNKGVVSSGGDDDDDDDDDDHSNSKSSDASQNINVDEEGAEYRRLHKIRKRPVDPFGFDIFRSGLFPRPKNPYFVTQIRAKRQDELFIPAEIIRVHQLELPEKTVLRDPEGRKWSANLATWKDGRSWYCGGWRNLCKSNLIADNDLCICEFGKSKDRGLYIQVRAVIHPGDLDDHI